MKVELENDGNGSIRWKETPGFGEFRDVIEASIRTVAADWGYEVTVYSGKFMNRASCVGIITDDPQEFVEQAAGLAVVNGGLEAGEALAAGAAIDTIAVDKVVYWPDLIIL